MSPAAGGRAWGERPPERLEDRISIQQDGTIVARSGKVEFGQGIRTGFARIVAEELSCPVGQVRVELGETDRVPWDMGTFGSLSIAGDGALLRKAAAYARTLLCERAAARLGVPAADLDVRDGAVAARDGRRLSYAELAGGEPLRGVVPREPRGGLRGAPASSAPKRIEALDIVTGRARYAADVLLPGMLHGRVLQPPTQGALPVSVDDRDAQGMPGVVAVVQEQPFIGVVAEREEQALAAARAIAVEWAPPAAAAAEAVTLRLRHDRGTEAALGRAPRQLRARYRVPHIAHASIGPSAAAADVRGDDADLYVSTQRPFGLRDEAAALLGLAPGRVHVHPQAMSGMYGRGNVADAALDAARLSRAVRRPVLVQFSRADEFRVSPARPVLDGEIEAGLDAGGALVAWRYRSTTNPHTYGMGDMSPQLMEMTSGRNALPPYRLGCAEVDLAVVPAEIRTAAFRSLAAAPNVFATESFMDELAHASEQDPVAFRMRHVDDARLRAVLEAVSRLSGWERRGREPGRGRGVACAIYNGTYVAQVVEVAVAESGRVSLERVSCAVDCGRLVHPDGARNQIEGAIQQAASWTLLERLQTRSGEVVTSGWRDYPIATFRDAPKSIDILFLADPTVPSSGAGEPGSVPTAAAIANAVYDACGARVRELPLSPNAVQAARR